MLVLYLHHKSSDFIPNNQIFYSKFYTMFYFNLAHYSALASKILEETSSPNYFSGRVEIVTSSDVEVELVASLIIYRRRVCLLDSDSVDSVTDVVPVWWDVTLYRGDGDVLLDHDFDFERLRMAIIEREA